ncbi:endonuclease/exonuclease/phosphatase family protein [Streptomyces sp. NBC_01455]|uniref:endonuclease/exonuclease/phosphatase family protein n=1 Tax=Streptomyces sp. NBC_01455 TaxID=2903874 RepID=UPI002E32E646|nr:endonuclease/exonuclease/phosphatase family protein [Streptomyces sp. NBC_01455]
MDSPSHSAHAVGRADHGAPHGRLRFATFNVLHGRPMVDGRPVPPAAADEPAEPLSRAVMSLDADVLALQEVDRFQERSGRVDQAGAAARAAGLDEWRYATALHARASGDRGWDLDPTEPGARMYGPRDTGTDAGVPSHGLALLTRLPVRDWRIRRLAPAPLGMPLLVPGRPGLTLVRDRPRAALAAVLEGPRGPFTAVAVHLTFVPGWNVRQLLTVRDWIAGLPLPHVLLGDFNLVGAVPRAVLNAPRTTRSTPPRRWRDTARTPTYPAHRPVVQFDHVLTAGIGAEAAGTAGTVRTAISDHRPLVVELSL